MEGLFDRRVGWVIIAHPAAKTAKPEQFVDLSFLQELEKEGFFNEMAKRYPSR